MLDSSIVKPYSRSVKQTKFLLSALISVLLLLILAAALFLDRQSSPFAYRTPIPIATITAYRPGKPIHTTAQAFVAAQFYLGTTRLRAAGDILPYQAKLVRYREAISRTSRPGETVDIDAVRHADIWLVLLEGAWTIEPPVPDPSPGTPQPGCAYAILDASNGEGTQAGGIRPCGDYQVRPANQIIAELFRLKGISAHPGTRSYGRLMRGIILGGYPELTGLVHNNAEMERVYEYAGQHVWDGIWRLGEQPREPDMPEALPPSDLPTPTESYPAQPIWADTPEAPPPTETPRPTQIPPPQATWHSPVITIPLPISPADKIQSGTWLSPSRLEITTMEAHANGYYWIDFGAGDPYISTPRPAYGSQQSHSASSLYSIQCGSPLQMMAVAGQTVISQADLILNPNAVSSCTAFVSWDGDAIASFAARAGEVWSTYLWLPDGSPPFSVGPALNGARPPAWSPDKEQFAFMSFPEGEPHRLQIMIADRSGKLVQTLPTSLVLQPTAFRWLGRQVLALRNSNRLWQYYQVETGEVLFTWQEALSMGSTLDHQYPEISPDGRWFPIERSGSSAAGVRHKRYSLYDIQNRREILLYDQPWHLFEFNGWSLDGDGLYLLHLPAGPDAAADPALPYGLLVYHPIDGQFELLVENARAVHWNANHQTALVVAIVQDGAGQLTLLGGTWDRSTSQFTGAVPFFNPPIQYDPLLHPHSLNSIIPAAWAPDGQQVAFFTWQGDLLLMKPDGQTQLIASQVGLGRSDFTRLLAWSPDGTHLFVSDRGTAWILTIP